MRKILVATGMALAVLTVPTGVSAKGAAGVTISGGLLDEPLEVMFLDERMPAIAEQTNFYESLWEPEVNTFATPSSKPAGPLGRPLTLAWDMDHDGSAPGPDTTFVQTLYPFAQGGPLVHTAAGQEVYLEPVRGGWHRADRAVLATLRGLHVIAALPNGRAFRF